jgi:hypothetical protein
MRGVSSHPLNLSARFLAPPSIPVNREVSYVPPCIGCGRVVPITLSWVSQPPADDIDCVTLGFFVEFAVSGFRPRGSSAVQCSSLTHSS